MRIRLKRWWKRCDGCFGGPGPGAKGISDQQVAQLNLGQNLIDQSFAGYNPEWYAKYRKAYTDAAMPQVAAQYTQAKKNLGFDLARKGQYKSGAGMGLGTALQQNLTSAQQGVADQAQNATNALQQQVENYRQQLYGQLTQSSAPLSTAQRVLDSASQFATPSLAPAIGNLFGSWANTYLAANLANPSVVPYAQPPSMGTGGSKDSSYTVNP